MRERRDFAERKDLSEQEQRQLFRQTFDRLHASPDVLEEVEKMINRENTQAQTADTVREERRDERLGERRDESRGESRGERRDESLGERRDKRCGGKRRSRFAGLAVAVAALLLVMGTGTAAYAMDVGGIQRTVQIWLHGDQTNAVLDPEKGTYEIEITDENGQTHIHSGGGIAMEPDGTERPVTEEELLEYLSMPDVSYEEDGRILVWCQGKAIDITDRFENGVCRVQVQGNGRTYYMTINLDGGFAISEHAYPGL